MCCFDSNAEEAACIYVKFFYVLTSLSIQVSNNFSLVYTHTHTRARAHTRTRTHGMWKHSQTAVCFIKPRDIHKTNTARGEMGLADC